MVHTQRRNPFRSPLLARGLLAAAMLWMAISAEAAEVTASLSTQEAFVGAPVTLVIQVDDTQDEIEPELPEVDGLEFRSLDAPRRSSQTTIINGRRSDSTSIQYLWQVTPQRAGTFTIPPIAVQADGETLTTRPLQLVASQSETGDLLFVDIETDQQRIYLGQPLRLTLKIWLKPYRDRQHELTLSASHMWNTISLQGSRWGAFAEPLQRMLDNRQQPQGREVLRATSDGQQRAYYLYEIAATVYPRRPRQVEPPDVRIVVNYPTALGRQADPFEQLFDSAFPFSGDDPFFSHTTLRVTATRPLVAAVHMQPVQVIPLPTAGQPDDFRGAVGKYEIVTQATPTSVQAGDPITLNIGIHGDGPMELVQAPPLHQYAPLADDFKVPDQPLAGIVDGPVKLFSLSIRPRHAGVSRIPALPFTYFDPDQEQYVTIHSDPITIHVEPAESLAIDSIVATDDGSSLPRATRQVTDAPQLQHDHLLATLQSQPESGYRWPLVALLLPPLGFAFAVGGKLIWPHLAGGGGRRAAARIRAAHSPAELFDAVRAAVGNRFPEQRTDALTRVEIVALLQRAGRCDQAAEIDNVLADCERMLYGRTDAAPLDALKARALAATVMRRGDRGGRHADVRVEGPPYGSGKRALRGAAATHTALALALWLAAAADPLAARADVPLQLSQQQQQRIFAEANQAYERGQKTASTDAEQARRSFQQAAEKYRTLVHSGIRNDRLYVNLGNAYLQAGQPGQAIASYLRALQINPDHQGARVNLRHAQQRVPSQAAEPGAVAVAAQWIRRHVVLAVPHQAWLTVALAAWAALWTAATVQWFRPLAYGRAIIGALLIAVGIGLFGWWNVESERFAARAVTVDQTVLRAGSGDRFSALLPTPLPEGTILQLVDDRGEWLQVRLDDGTTGWIDAAQTEVIAADGVAVAAGHILRKTERIAPWTKNTNGSVTMTHMT